MWCAVEGLGGEASSEAEIALRVRGEASDGPYRGAGSWAERELGLLGTWRGFERCGSDCLIAFCVFEGAFSPLIRVSLITVPDNQGS